MKFGIIGTNWITGAYVDGALDSGLWELSAIYSRKEETGLAFGEKYGVTNIYTDLEKMAACEEIDAVYIASPNSFHFEQSKLFLKNKKHVICEKPVASHGDEVKILQHLAKENGVIFLEAIMFMHLPQKELLKEAISKIGKVSMATFDFSQRSSRYDSFLNGEIPNVLNAKFEGGALMDLGVYCLYPALYYFGMPKDYNIYSSLLHTGADGYGIINMQYDDKLVCIRYSKIGDAGANTDIQADFGCISVESISRLAEIEIMYPDKTREKVCGTEEKFKLMGYEAIGFYNFITNTEKYREEYEECNRLSLEVAYLMEDLRKKSGIVYESDA